MEGGEVMAKSVKERVKAKAKAVKEKLKGKVKK